MRKKHTTEYTSWAGMKQRCTNKKHKEYKNYGGRGISFCQRWKVYENFIFDMGKKPSKKHSLDRINNNGNYMPSNCRWATKRQQTHNRRRTVWVEYKGVKMPLHCWKKKLHMSSRKIKRWVVNGGLKLEDVKGVFKSYLSKKVKDTKTGREFNSIREAADYIKMHPDSLRNRLKGKTPNHTNFILV